MSGQKTPKETNFITKLFTGALYLVAGLSLYNATTNVINYIDYLYSKKDNQVVEHLVLNLENKVRTISYEDERQGIEDMRKILEKSPLEEAWAYLPNKGEWHETAEDQYLTKFKNGFSSTSKIDSRYIIELANSNNTIYSYHIHPDFSTIKKALDDKPTSPYNNVALENIEETTKEKKEKIIAALNTTNYVIKKMFCNYPEAAPSLPDITSTIAYSVVLKEINPNFKIVDKIVSSYGVTEYQITAEGIMAYETGKFESIITEDDTLWTTDSTATLEGKYINITFKKHTTPLQEEKQADLK